MNWSEGIQGQPMRWVQPHKLKMNYQLVRGNDVIATLQFKSIWGSLATAENADGYWTFKRIGFAQNRATIRPRGSETEIATFRHNNWKGGGTLEFADGQRILATMNLWQNQLEFERESGERLIQLKYDSLWCTSARVDIRPAARTAPETSWMVALGWYLMVMTQQLDAASCTVLAMQMAT